MRTIRADRDDAPWTLDQSFLSFIEFIELSLILLLSREVERAVATYLTAVVHVALRTQQ